MCFLKIGSVPATHDDDADDGVIDGALAFYNKIRVERVTFVDKKKRVIHCRCQVVWR